MASTLWVINAAEDGTLRGVVTANAEGVLAVKPLKEWYAKLGPRATVGARRQGLGRRMSAVATPLQPQRTGPDRHVAPAQPEEDVEPPR